MSDFLNGNEKAELVKKLSQHYTYPSEVSTFITALSEIAMTRIDLQLKAFAVVGKEIKLNDGDSPYAIVQIDNVSSKLILVKAVKETTGWGLKESKDFVDTIMPSERIPETGVYAYTHIPFKVGPKERITVNQWKTIADTVSAVSLIKWHFV